MVGEHAAREAFDFLASRIGVRDFREAENDVVGHEEPANRASVARENAAASHLLGRCRRGRRLCLKDRLAHRLSRRLAGLTDYGLRVVDDLRWSLVVRVLGDPSAGMKVTRAENGRCDRCGEESFHIRGAGCVARGACGLGGTTIQQRRRHWARESGEAPEQA